jgi:uncharacterized membrane protein
VLLYFTLAFGLSAVRYWNFFASNFDLGLYQQSLWSYAHGRGFFDSADYIIDGSLSLLRTHPSVALYGLAGVYWVSPTSWTLFAVQSLMVALAALPIFYLTRDSTGSGRLALLGAGLYLLWAPTLSGNLFDFHLEAFLPAELLTLFLLWSRGWYILGSLAAIATFLTFEAGAAFAFLIGLYFALPALQAAWRRRTERRSDPRIPDEPTNSTSNIPSRVREWLRTRRVLWSIGLMAASTIAYFLILAFQASAPTIAPSVSPVSSYGVLTGGPSQLSLSFSQLYVGFAGKTEYWILLYALVAFLPLRAARSFVIAVPWIVATYFGDPKFTLLGNQYGFLAALPVFVGVAYGLRGLDRTVRNRDAGSSPDSVERGDQRSRSGQLRRSLWHWGIVLALGANVALSPVNPLIQNGGLGAGYNLSLAPQPGYPALQKLLQLLPSEAPLIASDDLFPFVANDVHAYGLPFVPYPPFFLPFNVSNPPSWALIASSQVGYIPPWLGQLLANKSIYGLRGTVGQTPAGIVELFQLGYRGLAENLGPGSFATTQYAVPDLRVGFAGEWMHDPTANFLWVIETIPNSTGNLWYGPYADLPLGNYSVTIRLKVSLLPSANPPPPSTTVLRVDATGFAIALAYNQTFPGGTFPSGAWTTLSFTMAFSHPTPRVEVRGYQLIPQALVEVATVTIAPNR